MGIHVAWDDDTKTILCHTHDGSWTIEDLHKAITQSIRMLAEVDHPVDQIIDMRTSGPPPAGVLPVYQYGVRNAPRNQRLTIVVQAGTVMKALFRVIETIAPYVSDQRFQVETMEDARALIANYHAGPADTK